MLMQALNILENFDLKAMGHNSPAYIHTVAEALKLCFGDREAFYGDPDFATVPMDGLLSKEYAAIRAGEIDPEGAYPPSSGRPAIRGGSRRSQDAPRRRSWPRHSDPTPPPMTARRTCRCWTSTATWCAAPSAAGPSPSRCSSRSWAAA